MTSSASDAALMIIGSMCRTENITDRLRVIICHYSSHLKNSSALNSHLEVLTNFVTSNKLQEDARPYNSFPCQLELCQKMALTLVAKPIHLWALELCPKMFPNLHFFSLHCAFLSPKVVKNWRKKVIFNLIITVVGDFQWPFHNISPTFSKIFLLFC